jgi:hypothetical protein
MPLPKLGEADQASPYPVEKRDPCENLKPAIKARTRLDPLLTLLSAKASFVPDYRCGAAPELTLIESHRIPS